MQDSLYVALSSQIALERRLDTIADNVANASTIGFRATGVKFEDVVSGSGPKSVSFASSGKTYLSGAHGAMTQTGNPFDFAVQGDAWFGIDTPAGTVMTRDGRTVGATETNGDSYRRTSVSFPVPKDQVVGVVFRYRSWETVELRNVSLKSGAKTTPKVTTTPAAGL